VNLYEAFASGRERGTERRAKRTLAEYMPAAIGGDQQALQSIYSVDPEAGYKVQGMARQQREQDFSDLARAADLYAKTGDPQTYAYLQQNAARLGPQFAGLPASITTPEDKEGSMKWAQALSETFGGVGGKASGVQSTYIDAQGNRVAIMRDGSTQVVGRAAPTTQVIEGEGGFYTVDKLTGRASPVVMGGQQQPAMPQQPQGLQFVGRDGKPVSIDPSLPPEVRQSIMQDEGAWANAPQGATAQLPPSVAQAPAQQLKPATAQLTPYQREQLRLQQEEVELKRQEASRPDAEGETRLRKEYNDLLTPHRTVLDQYGKLKAAASTPSAANDLAMIFSFMKMLDPGSVVREQEFANAQNAAGVPDRVRNLYNNLLNGERLNPNQRAEFLQAAGGIATESQQQIDTIGQQYGGIATEYGYDPNRIIGLGSGSRAAPPAGQQRYQQRPVPGARPATNAPRQQAPRGGNDDPLGIL
jgi:hypothetical protein